MKIAFTIHLIAHIVGLIITMYNWVMYGGEFIVYNPNDSTTIHDIYKQLKENKQQ